MTADGHPRLPLRTYPDLESYEKLKERLTSQLKLAEMYWRYKAVLKNESPLDETLKALHEAECTIADFLAHHDAKVTRSDAKADAKADASLSRPLSGPAAGSVSGGVRDTSFPAASASASASASVSASASASASVSASTAVSAASATAADPSLSSAPAPSTMVTQAAAASGQQWVRGHAIDFRKEMVNAGSEEGTLRSPGSEEGTLRG